MRDAIVESLQRRFRSYDDLVASIEEDQLSEKLDAPRHKSLLEHAWCVIGARESYAQAITSGEWGGFSCSLSQYTHGEVSSKLLRTSADAVLDAVRSVEEWTDRREQLLLELAEHEVMHEGGIIRHMYAFELEIPATVKWA